MEIVRLKSSKSCELWEFISEHLPRSLRTSKQENGYGTLLYVEVVKKGIIGYTPFSDSIAKITDCCVELFYPEWYSDFEDIILKYEKQTGRTVTLKFWES